VEDTINLAVTGMCAMKVMNADRKESATRVAHICLVKEISATRGTTLMNPMRNVIGMAI
jgi:uncharacterized protein (UPF0212 family)